MIKGIIFDLDGVLVFTDRYHFRAWKLLADRLGIPFEEKDNDRLRGVSRRESLELLLEGYGGKPLSEAQKEALMEEKNRAYRELLRSMKPADVSREVRDTLKELRKKDYLLAVGSSSKNAGFILKQTRLEEYFDAAVDGNDIRFSKPDPEVFEKAADRLGVPPPACMVVEDALSGIQAAKAAGMTAVYIGDDAGCEGAADRRIASLSELLHRAF